MTAPHRLTPVGAVTAGTAGSWSVHGAWDDAPPLDVEGSQTGATFGAGGSARGFGVSFTWGDCKLSVDHHLFYISYEVLNIFVDLHSSLGVDSYGFSLWVKVYYIGQI